MVKSRVKLKDEQAAPAKVFNRARATQAAAAWVTWGPLLSTLPGPSQEPAALPSPQSLPARTSHNFSLEKLRGLKAKESSILLQKGALEAHSGGEGA